MGYRSVGVDPRLCSWCHGDDVIDDGEGDPDRWRNDARFYRRCRMCGNHWAESEPYSDVPAASGEEGRG